MAAHGAVDPLSPRAVVAGWLVGFVVSAMNVSFGLKAGWAQGGRCVLSRMMGCTVGIRRLSHTTQHTHTGGRGWRHMCTSMHTRTRTHTLARITPTRRAVLTTTAHPSFLLSLSSFLLPPGKKKKQRARGGGVHRSVQRDEAEGAVHAAGG